MTRRVRYGRERDKMTSNRTGSITTTETVVGGKAGGPRGQHLRRQAGETLQWRRRARRVGGGPDRLYCLGQRETTVEGIVAGRGLSVDDIRPPAGLRCSVRLWAAILGHLRRALPHEGCGLLATREGLEGEPDVAMRFYPGTNVDHSRTRYTMDPIEVLAAFRDLEAHGWRLGAIVHSHPASPASPSATDLREAYYPESLMAIVSFAGPAPLLRAWQVAPAPDGAGWEPREVPFAVEPE